MWTYLPLILVACWFAWNVWQEWRTRHEYKSDPFGRRDAMYDIDVSKAIDDLPWSWNQRKRDEKTTDEH